MNHPRRNYIPLRARSTALTKSLTSYPALYAGDALGERRPVRSPL